MRKRIVNRNPTLLCPNCLGGILFHDLGLQFCSPTVNLMMFQTDFMKFVLNLDDYLQHSFEFIECEGYTCPCARLNDIVVHFSHYKTPEDAVECWNRRVPRMNKDNMFVVCQEKDGLTKEDILRLGRELKVRGLLVFTEKHYPDIPYTLQVNPIGSILDRTSWLTRNRRFNELFDFVAWFNEAKGNYDVSPYVKR